MTIREFLWELRNRLLPGHYPRAMGEWPLRLSDDFGEEQLADLRARVERLDSESQYGWGQTIDFGPFEKKGFLGYGYLEIVGLLDKWSWWPRSLAGMLVADLGCFTGGHSVLMAQRGAERVYAVDELSGHLRQCECLASSFGLSQIETIESSVFRADEYIPEKSLDMIVLSGVLYHMSDMLVGLLMMHKLLKPGGLLIIETNGVDDDRRSYANFGRYYGGMWWQPSGLCVRDMCEHMGFEQVDVRFYKPDRCLARAVRSESDDISFRRGMNWAFSHLDDDRKRTMDRRVMAPVRPRL